MKRLVTALALVAATALVTVASSVPAGAAAARPTVQSLSVHSGAYWGGTSITIHGQNFTGVREVTFGTATGWNLKVVSPTTLTVVAPWHDYATVHVQVVTGAGTSPASALDHFTFAPPGLDSPIQGGLTAHQEQAISATVRARHRTPASAPNAAAWTPAMGATAAALALSWVGLPYSWAGGTAAGPTTGVCDHNGGDLDCHVIGFDCSGLALYAWGPYQAMSHYAATQYTQAGRFHPSLGELMPGDLLFFAAYPGGAIDHVVIYVGNGQIVEAPESGEQVHETALADLLRWSTYSGATRPHSVGRQAPAPVITGMTATVSDHGGPVTVVGANLASTTSVIVNGTRIYSFSVRTATRLVFTAPSHALGLANVEIDNSWGSAIRSIVYAGPPQVSAISTRQGSTAGGNLVTFAGPNLGYVTKVTVGTTVAAFGHLGVNGMAVRMPAHAAGAVAIVATSPFGVTKAITYTYVAPTPPSPPAPPSPSPSRTLSARR